MSVDLGVVVAPLPAPLEDIVVFKEGGEFFEVDDGTSRQGSTWENVHS